MLNPLPASKYSRYNFFNLLRGAANGHSHWAEAWRKSELKKTYDVVIIGGGGHGLATAYYLASKYGVRNIAVVEKGWIGGGNSGRNTQVVRSNYFYPESAAFFDHSLKLYENLSQDLNFNIMLSQRGQLNLCHNEHEMELMRRTVNAIQLNGVDCDELSVNEIQALVPILKVDGRYPVIGGSLQRRSGIARHDAVVWGLARAASKAGVDIIENCGVTGFKTVGNKIHTVETTRGLIAAGKVAMAVAGHSSDVAKLLGLRLPITSMALQAMVTEPIKPALNTGVISPSIHMYISQSDRGEMVIGGAADAYTSYAQRGGIPVIQQNVAAVLQLFPQLSRLKLMRQWAGIVDITPDTSPIMGKTPVDNFYISGGWGTGGYKAIPGGGDTLASTIAHDKTHPLIQSFGLERFSSGHLIDESAASGVAH